MNLPLLLPSWPGRRWSIFMCSWLHTCVCFLFVLSAVAEVPGGAGWHPRGEEKTLRVEATQGWSPDVLPGPFLAELGRFEAPSLWGCCCHHPGSRSLWLELGLEWAGARAEGLEGESRGSQQLRAGRASQWLLFSEVPEWDIEFLSPQGGCQGLES